MVSAKPPPGALHELIGGAAAPRSGAMSAVAVEGEDNAAGW